MAVFLHALRQALGERHGGNDIEIDHVDLLRQRDFREFPADVDTGVEGRAMHRAVLGLDLSVKFLHPFIDGKIRLHAVDGRAEDFQSRPRIGQA